MAEADKNQIPDPYIILTFVNGLEEIRLQSII